MSAPFRELFVELPLALFETLQGIGEAGVAAAYKDWYRDSDSPIRRNMLTARSLAGALIERYGWAGCEWSVSAHTAETHLLVYFSCGHRQCIVFDDREIAACANVRDVGRLLLDRIDETGRFCSCVQTEQRER